MPAREDILSGLTAIANDAQSAAIGWHVLLGALVLGLVLGWRPTNRRLGQLLATPFVSVSVLAWMAGNPFNAAVFAILAAVAWSVATRLSRKPVQVASPMFAVAGALLVAFGWTYPHFLTTGSWVTYVYAAPFGLLPCPTLAVIIGITLVCSNCRSTGWSALLICVGLLYGVIGTFRLGVVLDWGLLAGATVLTGAIMSERAGHRSVCADRAERTRSLPGDEFISNPLATLTHAVTIHRSAADVWPWLIQMGAGSRAGWYSYDFLDDGCHPSVERIVPELQHIEIGTIFPALPGVTDGFTVLAFQPARSLILGWATPDEMLLVTWAFVLEPRGNACTRLVVRVRGASDYRVHGLPPALSKHLVRAVHYAMQRKQLLGIVRRVERSTAKRADAGDVSERRRRVV